MVSPTDTDTVSTAEDDIVSPPQIPPPPSTPPQRNNTTRKPSLFLEWLPYAIVYMLCFAMYAVPVLIETKSGNPVLDEGHIVTNPDVVNEATTLSDIWRNDYWGRPLDSPSSHKSWRPATVLSFRWFAGTTIQQHNLLRIHRLVNIITHAATAHMVGILTVQFYRPPSDTVLWLRWTATLWFALHPTHVEATANAANRPHLLAVLCSVVCASPSTHWSVYAITLVVGLLASETFLLQIPAVCLTQVLVLLSARRRTTASSSLFHLLLRCIRVLRLGQTGLALRWLYAALCCSVYLTYRIVSNDSLNIPSGLIRPAENPYYSLQGTTRIWSYLYSWAVHVTKQWDMDAVGMSHEYGYNCLPAVASLETDTNWAWWSTVGTVVGLHVWAVWMVRRRRSFWLYLSWSMASWLPVSGILKVGTFVSDRILVAATVPVSMLGAVWMTEWWMCAASLRSSTGRRRPRWHRVGLSVLWGLFVYSRVHQRCLEWMDSVPLLRSSLKTCPNFAKAHMEISKVHSGLYPELLDLKKARYHLKRAATIDPDFCDVHYQMAYVGVQMHKYDVVKLEKHLLAALQCPYTMGQAMPMWQQYWTNALDPGQSSGDDVATSRKRYEQYQQELQERILAESEKENSPEEKKRPWHPFAWNK